ncbi:hypothetical protein ACF0H5_023921 [Mactra antiquata]
MFLQALLVSIFAQYGHCLVMDTATTSTDALMVMLAEEKQLRAQLATQVTDMQNRLSSVESFQNECGCDGRPTGNVAFMAALSKDLLHCTKGQPVIFDSVKLNNGKAYNDVHGVFNAPVTGTYMFTTTLSVQPGGFYRTAFVRNNATNEIGYLYAEVLSIWTDRSTTIVTHLDAGDEVWMVCLSDSRIEGDHNHGWEGANDFHSHISGFLLSAD